MRIQEIPENVKEVFNSQEKPSNLSFQKILGCWEGRQENMGQANIVFLLQKYWEGPFLQLFVGETNPRHHIAGWKEATISTYSQ